jgi:hypothetical protein
MEYRPPTPAGHEFRLFFDSGAERRAAANSPDESPGESTGLSAKLPNFLGN